MVPVRARWLRTNDSDGAAPPLRKVVEDARRDLAPLAEAGAVADVEAAAIAALQAGTLLVALPGVHHRLQLCGGERALAGTV